jgi:HTH-type transcriptional regulator / antitoxin MqsA
MRCVSCSSPLVKDVRDITYTYKGQSTMIPRIGGEYCSNCDESIHDEDEANTLSLAMLEFNKSVDNDLKQKEP